MGPEDFPGSSSTKIICDFVLQTYREKEQICHLKNLSLPGVVFFFNYRKTPCFLLKKKKLDNTGSQKNFKEKVGQVSTLKANLILMPFLQGLYYQVFACSLLSLPSSFLCHLPRSSCCPSLLPPPTHFSCAVVKHWNLTSQRVPIRQTSLTLSLSKRFCKHRASFRASALCPS